MVNEATLYLLITKTVQTIEKEIKILPIEEQTLYYRYTSFEPLAIAAKKEPKKTNQSKQNYNVES